MNAGMGVMIGMLGGNASTVEAYHAALNKRIEKIALADDTLTITFDDQSKLTASDHGQSCCEHRYMVCDDDFSHYVGSTFTGMEIVDAPDMPDDCGESHEVQFLNVNTSSGAFQCASHNEHNGYYGGFWIVLDFQPAPAS